MKISFVGYFTFYNKNGLYYNVKDHSLLYITNKDLLIECVFFFFLFFSYQDKTSFWWLIWEPVFIGGGVSDNITDSFTLDYSG